MLRRLFFRRSSLASGRWLATVRAMVARSWLKNSRSRTISRRPTAHVGAGVPATINTHRHLSPPRYDSAEAERVSYDAYGKQHILADNGVVEYKPSDYGQFIGFTGRTHDWETGLAYFRARYFDHSLGRFIGRDPAGYVDGMGLYGAYYIPNFLDPSGMFKGAWHKKITVAAFENSGLNAKCIQVIVQANVDQDSGVYTNSGSFADSLNHGDKYKKVRLSLHH